MIDLKLKKRETSGSNEITVISEFYQQSGSKNNSKFKFARLDNNFAHYLPYLKDGAVKLYLHYAMSANNETGESWYGIQTSGNKIGVTERSINNWNKELEDMGLICRISAGRKSKSTFLLPITGFAKKANFDYINQLLIKFNLFGSNEHTRIFGRFQSVTKLYIKVMKEEKTSILETHCVYLGKINGQKEMEIPEIKVFLYTTLKPANEPLALKLLKTDFVEKVIIVKEKDDFQIGGKKLQCNSNDLKSFFINDVFKIDRVDENIIYEIMEQLTSDIDISDLPTIS